MTDRERSPLGRLGATWLAVGICASLALAVAVGYRVLGEWRATAATLARHRAESNAALLATALLRDMRGVHESVLASSRLVASCGEKGPRTRRRCSSIAAAAAPRGWIRPRT